MYACVFGTEMRVNKFNLNKQTIAVYLFLCVRVVVSALSTWFGGILWAFALSTRPNARPLWHFSTGVRMNVWCVFILTRWLCRRRLCRRHLRLSPLRLLLLLLLPVHNFEKFEWWFIHSGIATASSSPTSLTDPLGRKIKSVFHLPPKK